MYPALWAGYDQRVVRAEWFYVGSDGSCLPIHCDTILDKDIKHAYKQAAPWRLQERLRGTLQRPKLDEDKWYDLPNVTGGVKVQFESMHVARVTSRNFSTQIFPFLRESYLVRGFQNATALFDKVNSASLLSKWPRATETAPTGKSPPTMAAIDTTKPAHEADHTAKGNAVPPEGAEAATAPDGRTLDWDATLPSTKDTNTSVADESDGPGASCRGTDGPDLEALRSEAELAEATASDAPPGEAHNGSSAAASEEGPTEAHNAPRSTSRRHRLLRPDGKAQMALDAAAPWVALSEAFISRALSFRSQRLRAQPDVDTSPRAAEMPTAVQDESAPSPTPAPADLYDDDTSMPSTSMQPPQLLFCIHGIGQKLSEDYASMHFVHDIDRLRSIMREQLDDPDLRQLLNGGRVKLVPICWRRDLQFDPEEEHYTLQDLVNHAMLPAVRTVMTKVLLDVPFYFSRHHDRMERQVLKEMNRLYRLFVQRNPEFEARGGTVSVLAHSLGAMLAGDILTRQPTEVPPLRDVDGPRIHLTSDHLLFNVDKFFCVGSPLPIVLYMAGARLVARKRHDDDNDDATLDAVGKTGCMAMRSIYNIYMAADPLSFQLSATADAPYARMMRPVELPRQADLLTDALREPRLKVGALLKRVVQERATDDQSSLDPTSPPLTPRATPIPIEEAERGERRLQALNPNGCIDYVLENTATSSISQYIDVLRAHMGYWTSHTLANFVLHQLLLNPSAQPRQVPLDIPELFLDPNTESV